MSTEPRRLTRSSDDKVVAGVCAGLARYFNVDPVIVRVVAVVLALIGGAGIAGYVAAWLLVPTDDPQPPPHPRRPRPPGDPGRRRPPRTRPGGGAALSRLGLGLGRRVRPRRVPRARRRRRP